MNNKTAAIELSMTTIVVVVLSLTLLIMGFVLVRSVMCTSINIVGTTGDYAKGAINDLFGSTGGEVQCLGGKGDPVSLFPGKNNIISCGIRAESESTYYFKIEPSDTTTDSKILPYLEDWMDIENEFTVGPGDDDPKKVIEMNIPKNAPLGRIALNIEVRKGTGTTRDLVWSQKLNYIVTNVGIVRSALC